MNGLLDYILYAYRLNHAKMSAINATRIMTKDYVEGEDCFQQFYISMCIWEEDVIRKEIGIGSLFSEEEQSKGVDGLKYWAFEDFVRSGIKFATSRLAAPLCVVGTEVTRRKTRCGRKDAVDDQVDNSIANTWRCVSDRNDSKRRMHHL